MRKLIGVFCVFVFVTCLLSSCASHERCPAYGEMDNKSNPKAQNA